MILDNTVDKAEYDFATGLRYPSVLSGRAAPNGATNPLKVLPIGSRYCQEITPGGRRRWFTKWKDDQRSDDWSLGVHVITQRCTFNQFAAASAVGTLALTETIPVGAWVHQVVLTDVTGFTGDTSAVITVGDGTDHDRYNTGTPSVFTTAAAIDLGVPSGVKIHTAVATPTIKITSASGYASVTAGAFTIRIHLLG